MVIGFALGIVAGLRAVTPLVVVCRIADLGIIHLGGSRPSFMGSKAVVVSALLAILEIVNDTAPNFMITLRGSDRHWRCNLDGFPAVTRPVFMLRPLQIQVARRPETPAVTAHLINVANTI